MPGNVKYILIPILICAFPGVVFSQHDLTAKKAQVQLEMFSKFHFSPVPQDERVSAEIFDDFIDALDPEGLYFTQADLQKLAVYKNQIFTEIKGQKHTMFTAIGNMYKHKLVYADTLISFYTSQPFNFTVAESINLDLFEEDKKSFPLTEKDMQNKWNIFLKYQTIRTLLRPTPAFKEPMSADIKTLMNFEQAARNKVKHVYKRKIKKILQGPEGFENYVGKVFLNVLAKRYDPHSMYMSQSDKEEFLEMLSREAMTFGFYIDENDNAEMEITHIVPGGNAWQTNQVNVGDVLLRLQFPGQAEHDLEFADMEELNDIFDLNKTANAVTITFRKTNGQIRPVALKKEKMEQEDNIVKSYLLMGEKKIGYISLPSFYDEWNDKNPLGCGNDVAKEIQQLQNENINGLIFDLRFNGGGSLYEAINLAGIFIDEGPICILKDKAGKSLILKDMNRGAAYDGPLLIMVNGQSASASELLAAVLQDYHRAVIAGNATFGKATAQGTFPLDLSYDPQFASTDATSSLGYANITDRKFYRVSKTSHQNTGVLPDIYFPDLDFISKERESSFKYVLPVDTVAKNVVYKPLAGLPLAPLKQKSAERIKQNPYFKNVASINDSVEFLINTTVIPLQMDSYKDIKKRFTAIYEQVDSVFFKPALSYKVANHKADLEIFKVNSFFKDMNDESLKRIQHDVFLDEAYRVMLDLLSEKP